MASAESERFPTVTHIYGTPFSFSIEARKEVVGSFATDSNDAVCDFDGDSFYLHCAQFNDLAPEQFTQHLRTFIENELLRELDVFDMARLSPVMGTVVPKNTERYQQRITQSLGVFNKCPCVITSSPATLPPPDKGILVDHDTIIQKWTLEKESNLLSLVSSDRVMVKVGELSQCRIEYTNSEEIVIWGNRQECVDKAIAKLARLGRIVSAEQSFPLIFNFPILEGQMSLKLQLVSLEELKKLNDIRSKTTLLSEKIPMSSNAQNILVLSVIRGEKRVPVKQNATKIVPTGLNLWKGHVQNHFGIQADILEQNLQPMAPQTYQENRAPDNMIHQWLQGQKDPAECEDAFQSRASIFQQSLVGSETTSPPSQPVNSHVKRSRVVRGTKREETPLLTASANQPPSRGEDQLCNGQETSAIQLPKTRAPIVPPPISPPNSITIPDSNTVASNTVISTTSATMDSGSSRGWEFVAVKGTSNGILIDFDEPDIPPSTSKGLRRTMKQKAGQRRMVVSSSELKMSFEKAIKQILHTIRSRGGPVGFEIRIGRLLVSPNVSSPEFKKPFDKNQWPYGVPSSKTNDIAKATVFTPRLTTNCEDIELILGITQSQGRKLFKDASSVHDVRYRILCETMDSEHILIDIHEDKSFNIQGADILAGAVDWHFPLRAWDARLQITVQEWTFEAYRPQAQAIVDNLEVHICTGETGILFTTTTQDDTLSVLTMTYERATVHSVTVYPDLLLHLREVQDISMHKVPGMGRQYEGSICNSATMIAGGRCWWEVSLTSQYTTRILNSEKAGFEPFDEPSKWSPEEALGNGVVSDMYALAEEIVTNIDNVGLYNKVQKTKPEMRMGERSGETRGTSDAQGPLRMAKFW